MGCAPICVIHEHHASRLHFDFRLEVEGVLKSWAIPKGPSMNPQDKRLAIAVEDHTLEYGHFEGVIPQGCYGAGPVVIWDMGTFDVVDGLDAASSLTQGSLTCALHGKRLNGAFALIKMTGPRTTGNEWLLMKKDDEAADRGFLLISALTPAKQRQLKALMPPRETS